MNSTQVRARKEAANYYLTYRGIYALAQENANDHNAYTFFMTKAIDYRDFSQILAYVASGRFANWNYV